MIKKILYLVLSLIAILLAGYFYGVYENNRAVAMPEKEVLQERYEQSVQWLLANEDSIQNISNPMLWWMIQEAEKLSKDRRLLTLLNNYHRKHRMAGLGVWAPLFDHAGNRYLDGSDVKGLPYYNQHFIYALNCAKGIADDLEIVAEQNDPGFCYQPSYIYRHACVTHQLMGVNFLYTQRCGLLDDVDVVIQSLQQDIEHQLTWDIRVVDVYLQRVMVLLLTGAEASVKPVWIQNILDQQQPDGGWGDFQALIEITPGQAIGLSPRIVTIGHEKSGFHATAQGLVILAFLLERDGGS